MDGHVILIISEPTSNQSVYMAGTPLKIKLRNMRQVARLSDNHIVLPADIESKYQINKTMQITANNMD